MKYFLSLILISATLVTSGCSLFSRSDKTIRIADIGSLKVRSVSNEPIDVSHEDVVRYYQAYLAVATDPEMRVRVAHRIAGLKLQSDEIRMERVVDDEAALAEDRILAKASIDDYENLLKAFPDRVDNDAIYYQLAKAYSLAGQPYQAISVLEELVKRYPRSIYYLEAQFRLGQLLYAAGDYEMSEAAYQALISVGPAANRFYRDAEYLQGWSIFKQARYEESLLAFVRMLDEHFPDEATLEAAQGGDLDLLNDTLRIMAIMFDYLGDWNQIARFFDEHGARYYEYKLYAQLADQYYEKKYYKSAASTLRAYVDRYPDSDRAPSYYERLITGYETAGYPELLRKHKEIYNERFGVGTPYWESHDVKVRAEITVALSKYIWDLATFSHGWAQAAKKRSEKEERFNEAARWYSEYIRSFPEAADTVKAHFLLAEISFDLERYDDARNNYEIVAYQYPFYEDAAEAGYAALLAYAKYKPVPERELEWRQLNVASAKRFVTEFPDDPRRGTVLVNTAETLLKDKYYEQALSTARLSQETGVELPPRYRYGASLVQGHSSFELGFYDEAETALLSASTYEKLSRKERADLRQKAAAAIYKQGEQAKVDAPEQAVDHWLRLAEVVPESTLKVNAEYDAATLLMEMQDYDRAEGVLLKFRQEYPNHELTKDIPSKLIVAYEGKGEWRKAAFELMTLSNDAKEEDERRIACFQSAEYFEKANDLDNAIVMYKRYAHTYKTPFDPAIEAHYKLDQIYALQGDEDKRRFWLDKIIRLHRNGKDQQTERSRYLASSAAFQLAEFDRIAFEKVKITLPLAKSIVRKNEPMQRALKRYTQAVEMEVLEFTTPATFHIADMYAQMSKALMTSEKPKGMDEVEAEEYQYLLEDQAFPLDEAAIDIHQTNIRRTYDGLYDQWVKKSFSSMAELMPGQYNKPEKVATYVDQIR
ncbi:tetratricopeptide repeat protein [Thalassolituus oleivorans]|uniref:tetratricopeptide repeat protein n=1 Tax=Thalassolituus oleivorans TaxID=187493 RepID=UPI00042DDC92|nr:tetratricopeptide repeat protein [Thalassolituus oleivorans]AHK17591.1 hypothetical protein R615_09540 [Thalassolituus oleivorans R6-15]